MSAAAAPWWRDRRVQTVVVFAALAVVPLLSRDRYLLNLGMLILWSAYLGACWNFMSGYAGQFSFGHAAFFGVGAYTSTILLLRAGLTPWAGMVVGAVLAALLGLAIGAIVFRYGLRGHFLALITLAFAEIVRILITNADTLIEQWWPGTGKVTGGPRGLYIPLVDDFARFGAADRLPFYYTALVGTFALLLITAIIERRRLGYWMVALRESEEVAQSVGVPVMRIKLTVTAVSAFATALGGTFYAQSFLYIDPNLVAGPFVSVDIVLPAVVGGLGALFGPLWGSLVLHALSEGARAALPGVTGASLIVYGVVLIVVVILFPGGIVSIPERLRELLGRRRRATAAALPRPEQSP